MRTVGLKVLKNKLSEYVRMVAQGETVLISDRDRVVAELVPPQAGRSELLSDALLAEAVRHGHITPALFPSARSRSAPPVGKLSDILKGLSEDRGDH